MPDKSTILTLFSGGMDSFITACRLVEQGHKVILINFNNGCVMQPGNILHGVTRLQNCYGKQAIEYAGCYMTYSTMQRLSGAWATSKWECLGHSYPNLTNAQIVCLHCQTAMWVAAIAYAKAETIHTIAAGYKKSDPFCTGHTGYIARIRDIAAKNACTIELPVWDDDAWSVQNARALEMTDHGFQPTVLEPACALGRPVNPMTPDERRDLDAYFDNYLTEMATGLVERLIPVMTHIKLPPNLENPPAYPMPDSAGGLH